ncbi:hypothetical protein PISMIDRAFT_680842, partial [Pisolithus microcarpus 441]
MQRAAYANVILKRPRFDNSKDTCGPINTVIQSVILTHARSTTLPVYSHARFCTPLHLLDTTYIAQNCRNRSTTPYYCAAS